MTAPVVAAAAGDAADVVEQGDAVALLAEQTRVLEQIATGAPLADVLAGVASALERLLPGSSCSVLLLDRAAGVLRHGAAPTLPASYTTRVDGLPIGELAGSCGTAAFTELPVVAVDVRTDARWQRYRDLAADAGLRACWSTPIRGRDGVSGTFAVYHREPHRPTPREEHLVERLSHLASVAIDHAGLLAALARSQAEAAGRATSDFVSAFAHELRTPLQAITGFTELMTTLDLDAERRAAALGHIAAAAGHILSMADDVLDVSRIEARALPLVLVDLPLEPVVERVLAMVGPLADAEGVALHAPPPSSSSPPAGEVLVRADERRLTQVLLNLVTNGIRYTRAGGTVHVDWTVDDQRVRLRVRDTGPGIEERHIARLFTPFDRLGRGSDGGVGLGLPLARGLTEAMAGRLEVSSRVGEGTTVTTTLPRGRTP
ncbi:MAG: GAF domain-containing sensor histidine kinase [Quadrisphaera sp.]